MVLVLFGYHGSVERLRLLEVIKVGEVLIVLILIIRGFDVFDFRSV